MADIYVRSTDGSDSDNGSTWALAKATLSGAAAIDAAGDRIFLSQAHSESFATTTTFALAGTAASPVQVIGVNDANQPPTAVQTGATITSTGTSNIQFSGDSICVDSLTFNAGTGTSAMTLTPCSTTASSYSVINKCGLRLVNTAAASRIDILNGANSYAKTVGCSFRFANASQGLRTNNGGYAEVSGGGIDSAGSSPTVLMPSVANGSNILIEGFDASHGASSMSFFQVTNRVRAVVRNCKLPASWTGSLASGSITRFGTRLEMYNCDSGDTNYRLRIEDYAGTIQDETTIVRTGGASDGTTPLSWRMASSSTATYPSTFLASPEIARWNETAGSAITVTVEILTDGVTLTDAECWLEVQYLGTNGVPLSVFASDAKADVLATAANQASSSESWTTTGITTPVKQKLSVTITPQEKGYLQAVVKLARASTTVYVDPQLTVT